MEQTQVVELTADNFDEVVLTAPQPVLVDFWAPWCAPCRLMAPPPTALPPYGNRGLQPRVAFGDAAGGGVAPVVDALVEIFTGRLTVGKINVDRHPALAAPYGVTSIPTLKLFIGGEVVRTWVGAHYQEQLVRELAKALRSAGHQGQAECRNRWGSGQSQTSSL